MLVVDYHGCGYVKPLLGSPGATARSQVLLTAAPAAPATASSLWEGLTERRARGREKLSMTFLLLACWCVW